MPLTIDIIAIGQHILVLAAFVAFSIFWSKFGRLVLGSSTIILFCLSEYGWALLALVLWIMAVDAHRTFMAQQRAAGFYNGPWID